MANGKSQWHWRTQSNSAYIVGLISLALLIGAVSGYRWLSYDFTIPGQLGIPNNEVDGHVGLFYTETVTEDTNQEDNERALAFGYTVTDNTVVAANRYNRQGMNNGPVEGDDDVNEVTGGLMIGAVIAQALALLLMLGFSRASKCQTGVYVLVGFFAIISMGLTLAAVVVWGSSDMKDVICWRYEDQPENENGVDDASCGYGAAFYAAIVGAVFQLLFAITFFATVKLHD